MFCEKCGKKIDAKMTFCPQCGFKQNSNATNDDEWYCIINNERKGPYKVADIILMIKQRSITRESLVWKKGMQNWIPAGQSAVANHFQSISPTIPDSIVDNRFVWALATIPTVVSWILATFIYDSIIISIVTIVLNILFVSLDIKMLEKSEKDVENWMWLGLFLIPVYLFMRASKTDKNYFYGLTWCALFLIDLLIL